MNDAFANLLGALEVVGKTDQEMHAKYKVATNGLIDRMKAEL